jgi:predicted nucleotidyltransferase
MNEAGPLHIPSDELARFCRRYQVRELALFGSMLRQDHRPESDVDLLEAVRKLPSPFIQLSSRFLTIAENRLRAW